jgi:hypothetical protein
MEIGSQNNPTTILAFEQNVQIHPRKATENC